MIYHLLSCVEFTYVYIIIVQAPSAATNLVLMCSYSSSAAITGLQKKCRFFSIANLTPTRRHAKDSYLSCFAVGSKSRTLAFFGGDAVDAYSLPGILFFITRYFPTSNEPGRVVSM